MDLGCLAGEDACRPSEGGGVAGQPAGAECMRPAECSTEGRDKV